MTPTECQRDVLKRAVAGSERIRVSARLVVDFGVGAAPLLGLATGSTARADDDRVKLKEPYLRIAGAQIAQKGLEHVN